MWTPYSFRGKFISTSNAIPGRRLLLHCFCATCQSIIEEDIQRGCYQHAGTLQLTINRLAGENINMVAGEEVEKWERLQEKNSAFSIERCSMWCANEIFSSILYHRIFLGFKVITEIIWAQCQINKDTPLLWMWDFNHLLSPVPSKLLTAVLIVMKPIIVSPKDLM